MASIDFEIPREDELDSEFGVIPAGKYAAILESAELKNTKSGTGQMISCQFKIVDTVFNGRYVFESLNIKNDNEIAQKIGRQMLAKLAIACSKPNARDTAELQNIPISLTLKVEKNSVYGDKNRIKTISKLDRPTNPGMTPQGSIDDDLPF